MDDGSAAKDTTDGGSGVYVERWNGPPTSITGPAGALCSSYRAEMNALRTALLYIAGINFPADLIINPASNCVLICTDSQSAITSLEHSWGTHNDQFACDIHQLCRILMTKGLSVCFQWIPSHVGIAGNEIADRLANEGSNERQELVPIDITSAASAIRRHHGEEWLLSYRAAVVAANADSSMAWHNSITNGKIPGPSKHRGLSRQERVLLNQYRTGHSPSIPAYLHRIGKFDNPNVCPKCSASPCDRMHILECPALYPYRAKHGITHTTFVKEPLKGVEYLRQTGLWPCGPPAAGSN